MTDTKITVYDYPKNSYLELIIENDSLRLISEVYINDEDTSEVHYSFNKEETNKLIEIFSLEGFVDFIKEHRLKGTLDFLKQNNIRYSAAGY